MEESDESKLLLSLLETRIHLEEELHAILSLIPSWNTSTRANNLNNTIAILLSNEPSNEEIMTERFVVTKPNLLEMVLTNLKNDTKDFTARAKVKMDTSFATLQSELQSLLSGEDSFENKIAIDDITTQIETINNEKLKEPLLQKGCIQPPGQRKAHQSFPKHGKCKGWVFRNHQTKHPEPQL